MSHLPSLLSLYGRSSHHPTSNHQNDADQGGHEESPGKEGPNGGTGQSKQKQSQNRLEHFAVSALAFCLRYDEVFRAHFLKKCQIPSLDITEVPEILIQDGHEADMSLSIGKMKIIVEGKVPAALSLIQDPTKDDFWSPQGYGTKIKTRCAKEGRTGVYCTLTRESRPLPQDANGLLLRSIRWRDLQPERESKPTPLWRDLIETLARIADPALLLFEMNDKRNLSHAATAADTYSTLIALAEFLEQGRPKFNVKPSDSSGRSFFGIDDLDLANHPNEKVSFPAGWVGYEVRAITGDPNDTTPKPRLSVWAYCLDTEEANRVEAAARNSLGGYGHIEREGKNVGVLNSNPGISDIEWFMKILKEFKQSPAS